MTRENTTEPRSRGPKYPIRCAECGAKEVRPSVIQRTIEKNHDGRLYLLEIPQLSVNQCGKCGEVYYDNTADDQISAALRAKLRLLTPEQIRAALNALELKQKTAAECLGVAPETLSRWLGGTMIQSRAMDNLMRAFFALPEVRDALTGETMDADFGARADARPPEAPPLRRLGEVVARIPLDRRAQVLEEMERLAALFARIRQTA